MDIPLVSVIMPVYQVEQYIENSITSVCNQSYKNIEIILVDDGTKDKSMEIAKKVLINKNSFPYRIISQKNKGVSAARNEGIAQARGEWIICIDSDDMIAENFIHEMIISMDKDKNAEIIVTNYLVTTTINNISFDNQVNDISVFTQEEFLNLFLLRKIPVIVPGILIKKSFLNKNKIRYDEEMSFSEDQQYMWQLFHNTLNVIYIWNKRYLYVKHNNSTMTASKKNKVLNGYSGMIRYTSQLTDVKFRSLIMSRWVFGAIHASAKMMDVQSFIDLLMEIQYKKWMKELKKFPDNKIKLVGKICSINKRISYRIFKVI